MRTVHSGGPQTACLACQCGGFESADPPPARRVLTTADEIALTIACSELNAARLEALDPSYRDALERARAWLEHLLDTERHVLVVRERSDD